MNYDKSSLVRQLVPTSYHFDAYNEINFPNSRDKPFFSDGFIQFDDEHSRMILLVDHNKICISFSSVCPHGKITFQPYYMTLEDFVSKLKKAVNTGRNLIPFELSTKYNYSYSSCHSCKNENASCRELKKKNLEKVYAAVSFNFEEMKEALASYFEITNTTSKGGNIMRKRNNKFFGINFEFGLSKDSNIASTLMGMAVKNPQNGNWYVFDPERNTRKNLANVKLGNFPVMLLPTQQYVVGHLYKEYGQYYYVKSLNPNGTVTLISAIDGIIREQLPEESLIPGMNFHTEVIAFDAKNLMNGNSKENIGGNLFAAMLMMNWSKGDGAEFSLDNINDESFNGLGQYLPLVLMSQNGHLGNMFTNPDGTPNIVMLMALGSGDSDNNDMMQMMVLSQLLGGGNNPFSGVLPSVTAPATYVAENKVVCEKCGTTYPEGTNFCPKCGGKTKTVSHTCRVCGATLMEGAAFCHKCGSKVVADVCPTCGRAIGEGENFCPGCGTPLKESTPVVELSKSPTSEPEVSPAVDSSAPTTEA